MAEVYTNAAQTFLNGAIDAVQTSVSVTGTAGFPLTGNFRILIGSEYLVVTAIVGNIFTVQRGVEGSTAAPHATATSVRNILTQQALTNIVNQGALSGGGFGVPGAPGEDAEDVLVIPGPPGAAGAAGAAGPPGISPGVVFIPVSPEDNDDPLVFPGPTGAAGATGDTGSVIGILGVPGIPGDDGDEGLPGPPGQAGSGGGGGTTTNYGTFASLPAAGTNGNLYFCSDSPYSFRDNGATWQGFVKGWPATPVPTAGWNTASPAGSTTLNLAGGMGTYDIVTSAGNTLRVRYRAIPTVPYTITMGCELYPTASTANFFSYGMVLFDSVSGKVIVFQFGSSGSSFAGMFIEKWTTTTAFSGEYTSNRLTSYMQLPTYFQIADDNTNFIFKYGMQPDTLIQLFSVGRGDFFTTGYDSIGFFLRQDGGDNAAQIKKIYSWG